MKQKSILKNFNNSKGITLIALVVTIIILLILAGISISMLTGNNGIISSTETSKQIYEIGQYRDIIQVARESARKKKLQDETVDYVDEISKILKQENNITDIANVGNEIIRVTTKEGYVFKVTDISVNLIEKNDIKFEEENNESNESDIKKVKIKSKNEEKIQYKIDNDEWKSFEKEKEEVEVPFGSTIYARTYDGEKHGIEIDLFVCKSNELYFKINEEVLATGKTGEKKSITIPNKTEYTVNFIDSMNEENNKTVTLSATLDDLQNISLEEDQGMLSSTNIPETYIYTFGSRSYVGELSYNLKGSINMSDYDITCEGYSFGGWKSDKTNVIYCSDDVYEEDGDDTLRAIWYEKGDATCVIKYYYENIEDDEYEEDTKKRENNTEKIGTNIVISESKIETKNEEGFEIDKVNSELSGEIKEGRISAKSIL